MFASSAGRQVLGLDWINDQDLRVRASPPDEGHDPDAAAVCHVAVLHRADWLAVTPGSVGPDELTGPREPAPRPLGAKPARALLAELAETRTRKFF